MERRKFIKTGCQLCLLAMAGAALPSFPAFAGGKPKAYKTGVNDNNQAEIPVELFNETNLQIVRVKGEMYDIALHKNEEGIYTAFLMRCTHMDNQLYLTSDGFKCSMHGSEYDKKGMVTKGPSELPLVTYPTSTNDTYILINIPKSEE